MYTGKYLETGENIGHEIINLFKSNNGKYYIYLNSQGTIASKYVNGAKTIHTKTKQDNKKGGTPREIDILLTRPINAHVLQVIALAKNVAVLDSAILSEKKEYKEIFSDKSKRREAQQKMEIKYGNKKIDKILAKNQYKNSYERDIFATFETDKLYKPKEPMFLCSIAKNKEEEKDVKQYQFINGKYEIIETDNGFGKQSLRLYFTNNDKNISAFNSLSAIIDETEQTYWTDNHNFKEVDLSEPDYGTYRTNFLSIIKEEDRELTFSNLLQYFLSDKSILKAFCEEILKININVEHADISVNREEHNVDLIIRDGKNIIIIENKILSGINGMNKDYTEQLAKIFGNEQEESKKEEQEIDEQFSTKKALKDLYKELKEDTLTELQKSEKNKVSKPIVSQLSKYYFYARKIALEEGIDKNNIKLYIICPFYQAKFYDTDNLKQYLYGEKYTTKTYRDLLDFFEKYYKEDNFYLKEFINAMRKHANKTNNSKEEEMKMRFIKAINKAND